MRTLIVEDDISTRKILTALLKPYSDYEEVANGKDALRAFAAAWKLGQPFDLILLDILMPELDGHRVLKEIRDWEQSQKTGQGPSAKIIMLTSLDDRDNIMEAFRSKCDGYLLKPIVRSALFEQLRTVGQWDFE